jgi:hypothetical protein
MSKNFISIVITGQDEKGRDLVGSLMHKTLTEHGFTNVAVVNNIGEPTIAGDFESIYDIVHASNPGLFNEPIRIWGSVPESENEGEALDVVAVNSPLIENDQQFVSDAIEADVAMEEAST